MFGRKRKRTYVDRPVQGKLIRRVVMYWTLCMSGTFCLLAGTPIVLSLFMDSAGVLTTGQIVMQVWRMFWPALFASLLVLPVLLLDVVRVSHRFVGPMYRLRNALRDAADGRKIASVKFREGDFWWEMAEEFNRVAARLEALETTVAAADRTSNSRDHENTPENSGSVAV